MIELVTFTGVDSATSIDGLAELSRRYPRVEFGVLVGSQLGGIFPPLDVVESLKARGGDEGFMIALHLCGRYARMAVNPDGADPGLWALCAGFGRVQVNLHGDWFDPSRVQLTREGVERFADRVDAERIILQHRGGWETIPSRHEKIEYLFDVSEGGGVESFANWPAPSPRLSRVGYAGGLGPDNIGRAVDFAAAYPEASLWFDMESRIRTNGVLDLDAVESVCRKVFGQ